MVPCRLTGKPFWDIHLHQDPPLWKAHIDAIKFFDIDGGFELYDFGPEDPLTGERSRWTEYLVKELEDGSFATQRYRGDSASWSSDVRLYTAGNPPATGVRPEQLGLPPVPTDPRLLTGVREWPTGMERWLMIREELGDHGVMGMQSGMVTNMMDTVEQVYAFHDDPKPFYERAEQIIRTVEQRIEVLSRLRIKPDFLFCGASGSLIFQSPQIFRSLVLPVLKRTTELASDLGILTHVHSCGPEAELVRMAAEETHLNVIDPLEIAPVGDCDLAELSRLYGDRIILKGNLHTTTTMLHGTEDDVARACRAAIDDAGRGGRFILSTGDQCGRDTPDANIRMMVEVARTYGRY